MQLILAITVHSHTNWIPVRYDLCDTAKAIVEKDRFCSEKCKRKASWTKLVFVIWDSYFVNGQRRRRVAPPRRPPTKLRHKPFWALADFDTTTENVMVLCSLSPHILAELFFDLRDDTLQSHELNRKVKILFPYQKWKLAFNYLNKISIDFQISLVF